MPNVMAAQGNTGGTLCQSSVIPLLAPHRKVWLMPAAGVLCSNAVNIGERKTGVPQTGKQLSAASGPKYVILWGRVEEIMLFNKYFSDCQYMP